MPFKAAEVAADDDLNFDLDPYGPKGTVPEPSRAQLEAYFEALRQGAEEAGIDREAILEAEKLGGSDTREGRAALAAVFADAEPEKLKQMTQGRLAAVAALCGGSPTQEEIEALPYRHQEAFTAWLTEKFGRPTQNGASPD